MVWRGWGNSRNGGSSPPFSVCSYVLVSNYAFWCFPCPFPNLHFYHLETCTSNFSFAAFALQFSLHKICENTGFQWHIFSRISTKSTILSLYGRIRVSENPYSRIFYAVFSYGISCVQKSRNFSLTSWENGWNLWSQFLFFQVKSIKISTWSKHGLTLATMLVIVI